MEIKDIYWIAGFLEGEGTFFISTTNRFNGTHGLKNKYYGISAGQNASDPLEKLKLLLGGAVWFQKPCEKRPRGFFRWTISTRKAIGAMMMLYQLMSEKRKLEIRKAIVDWKHAPRLGDAMRKRTHCPKGHPYDEKNTVKLSGNRRGCRLCAQAHSSRRAKLMKVSEGRYRQ